MILSIVLVLVIFTSVVLVHEWGHFIAARRNGIEVEEFGFGFPPRAIGIKRGKTVYSINWLPLGGFVRMKGEDEVDSRPGTFNAASIKAKSKVLLAGVAMNLLMAYIILVVLALFGLPKLFDGQFSLGIPKYSQAPAVMAVAVGKETPAARAGITPGTLVLAGDGHKFTSEADLQDFTKAHAGQTVSLEFKRGSLTKTAPVHLNAQEDDVGYLGVTPFKVESTHYGLRAPVVAAGLLVQLVWKVLAGLGALLAYLFGLPFHHVSQASKNAAEGVAGPVGIVVILSSIMRLGWAYIMVFVLSICVSLAVINALPLPALDGGRLFFTWLRKGFKWPSLELEGQINRAGFVVLLLLMVVVTYFDVRRFL